MSIVAAIQMISGCSLKDNLSKAERLIAKAKEGGAELVVLPENFSLMGLDETDKVRIRERFLEGPIQTFLMEKAKENDIWLVGGTVPLVCDDPDKILAACMLYNPSGRVVSRYDKMHLFDVDLIDTGECYRETETISPGHELIVAKTPFGILGLSVCYDLRFPELFRSLVDLGMEIIVLPAAFTATTGRIHWECLVRARAIENSCYMIAVNQGGYHENGYHTYGNSMIVDPWGRVIGRLGEGENILLVETDIKKLRHLRESFPCLQHRILK